MTPTAFHRFPDLPPEIREEIWKHTFPSTDCLICLYDWRWDFSEGAIPGPYLINEDGYCLSREREVHVEVPTAFFVNQDSRDIAKRWMEGQELELRDPLELHEIRSKELGLQDEAEEPDCESRSNHAAWPTRKGLGRKFDQRRDAVYISPEAKNSLKEELVDDLDEANLQFDVSVEDASRSGAPMAELAEQAGLPVPDGPRPIQTVMNGMVQLVVPAFTGYYSTDFMIDILKYRKVETIYVVFGKLPEPEYARGYEADIQPHWRLEEIQPTEGDDEVEMFCSVQNEPRMEKGSLSEWMGELVVELLMAACDEADLFGDLFDFPLYVESIDIVPVRLVEDQRAKDRRIY